MLQSFKAKADKNEIEVEDIISVCETRDPKLVPYLRSLKERFNYKDNLVVHDNGSITPPMGAWIKIGCIYIEDGFEGLLELSKDESKISYCLSFLEQYKNRQSAQALIKIVDRYGAVTENEYELIMDIISSINIMFSFDESPEITPEEKASHRNLVHRTISLCKTDSDLAIAMCALRGVGNADSIALVKSMPKLQGAWSGTEKIVAKEINKRLRQNV